VPIKSSNSIDGWDSVLSILQMPSGVPVATVRVEWFKKCGNIGCTNHRTFDKTIAKKLTHFKSTLQKKVEASFREIEGKGGGKRVPSV